MEPPPPPWYSATNYSGASYYNKCSSDINVSVPRSFGAVDIYQYPLTGDAYLGLFYLNFGDGRNYVQIKLTKKLVANKRYYCEHFVNLTEGSALACNNVGMLLTQTPVYVDTANYPFGVLPATPQILNYGNPIINDTMNWVKVSGVFKATGGEQYLSLGNFKYDSNTVKKMVNPSGYNGAGYIIDDVSIIPLDSFCLKADAGRDTTIKVGDSVFIGSYTNGIDSIKWYNSSGQVIDSVRPGFWVKPTTTGTSMYIVEQIVSGCYSRDTVYINAILPLTMSSYQVAISNKKSVLNKWETMNEINVSHFKIQRSINGKDFTTIGKVEANNKTSNEYRYTDNRLPLTVDGKLYYRIAGVDNDGKITYSQVRQVTMSKEQLAVSREQLAISIYPNPAKDALHIYADSKAILKIYNVVGKQIALHNLKPGDNSINIEQLMQGVYIAVIETANGVVTRKIVKE